MIASAVTDVSRLSRSASRAASSPRLSSSSPGLVLAKIATTGTARNASAAASAATLAARNIEAGACERVPPGALEEAVDEPPGRLGVPGALDDRNAVGDLGADPGRQLDRLQLSLRRLDVGDI